MVKHAAEQLHFTANGMRYAAQRWRNTDSAGPLKPVLCLHGWLDNSESFARLAPLLEQCDVLALDMAGHGETSHRCAHARYDIYDDLEDIADLSADFGWQQFNLLAHSRGAGIAMLFATIFPERVNSLVSLDGISPPPLANRNFVEQLRAHIEQRAAMRNKLPKPYADVDQAIEKRLQSTKLSAVDAREMFLRDLVQNDEGYIWRHDRRLHGASAVRMSDEHISTMLTSLQTPTLVIGAEQGMLAERELLQGARENPKIKISSHPGTHHMHLATEHAPGVAAMINRWWGDGCPV